MRSVNTEKPYLLNECVKLYAMFTVLKLAVNTGKGQIKDIQSPFSSYVRVPFSFSHYHLVFLDNY